MINESMSQGEVRNTPISGARVLSRAKDVVAALRERIADARNRLFANPDFHEWASSFPLTAPITRARAGALFNMCTGFVHTQILLACVELGVFDLLEERPRRLDDIARATNLPSDAAERLVSGAVALGLLERRRGAVIALGPQGAALLGNRSVFAMIRHHRLLYNDLSDPVALLRGGRQDTRLSAYWAYARSSAAGEGAGEDIEDAATAPYSELMAATQEFIARDVLEAFSFRGRRKLLDVGGGAGAFATAAALKAPDLSVAVFDLPAVAARATARFADAGLGDRARAIGGDFFADTLPTGHDVISFVRVLHDHDDAAVASLLASARKALAPGGVLLIAEPMAETPGARAMGDAYFGFYLWAMGSGRPRSFSMLKDVVQAAGFSETRSLSTRQPLLTSVLVAK
ncbi:MAG: methyltransferase [Pseudomonadota bacterium]